MNLNIYVYTTAIHLFALSIPSYITAMEASSSDPLATMSYERAFDQSKIHQEFGDVMANLGCHANLLNTSFSNTPTEFDTGTHKRRREEYETACVKKLKTEQKRAITQPACESLAKLGLYLTMMGASANYLGIDGSFAGGFSVISAGTHTAMQMPSIIDAGFHLWYPPDNILAPLEEKFAKDQCFIPHEIWPTIKEKFMIARTNPIEQRKAMEYLRFVLNLTQFKPQRELGTTITEQQLGGLYKDIDGFFKSYTDVPDLAPLKTAAANFVASSINGTTPPQSHIYVQGAPGLGKTFFAHWLYHTMVKRVPKNTLIFKEITINGSDDLEGNAEKPELTLRLLQQQLTTGASTFVFCDEAGCLCTNDPSILSAVKRTFQVGDSRDTFKTTYLGSGPDGTGIELKRPCLLQLFAGNDVITDAALNSRFTTFKFPAPCKQALIDHALEALASSTLLSIKNCEFKKYKPRVEKWIDNKNVKDFRQISTSIEAEFLQKPRKIKHSEK